MSIWNKLNHLFKEDDDSLPDIYIENISNEEIIQIYTWVMSITKPYGEPYIWSLEQQIDIPITETTNPVKLLIEEKIEPFRHGLQEFKIRGVKIPQLSIYVNNTGIEFDYRMGAEWGEKEVESLFFFLVKIKEIAPNAKIFQADEGRYDSPNKEFTETFEDFTNRI